MHRLNLLLAGLILFATGCGQSQKLEESQAEITKLKSEQQKLVAEHESQLTNQKEQAKKELETAQAEAQKVAEEKVKKLEAESLSSQKERDDAKQEVQRLEAKSREMQTQLTAKMQDNATTASELQKLTAEKSKADQELAKAKKDADALQSDFKKQLDTVTTEKSAAMKDVETLKTQVVEIKAQVRQLKTDPRILTQLKDFEDAVENTGIIGFKPGKEEEVRAIMKALGFTERNLNLKLGFLVCQWSKPLTEDDLKVIESFRSVITSFEPNRRLKKNSVEAPADATDPSSIPDPVLQLTPTYDRAAYLKDRWGLQLINAPTAWNSLKSVTPEKRFIRLMRAECYVGRGV